MKKFRFALLALGVAAISFAFTKAPEKIDEADTVFAFDASGNLIGSGTDYNTLDGQICPGNSVLCAHVWTSKTEDDEPAGTQLPDMKRSQTP